MTYDHFLAEPTETLIDARRGVYGEPQDTFPRIAQMWSGILGFEVQAWQVPLCQAALKMVRATEAPDYSDNIDDIEGFMKIYREIIGPDMIEARSVSEYLTLKGAQP